MAGDVTVGRHDAIPVISRRVLVTLADIGRTIGSSFQEAYGYLGSHGIAPSGPPFVIYHGLPGGDAAFEVEICAPIVRGGGGAPPGWQVRELPGGTFATLTHRGPYETLGAAYAAIQAWISGHNLAVAGPPRETYLSEPDTPPEQVETVIEFPVTELAVGAPG
jgi:AraC family transcriptional regulator